MDTENTVLLAGVAFSSCIPCTRIRLLTSKVYLSLPSTRQDLTQGQWHKAIFTWV